ncbi:prepilin-type N-terminal cleavage/methylation domain-containing protein [Candidatus Saccharibacteria bacterium]|nr:MAG: prepilin-type N-terminal cleavage/methylation domain-containing protein [Candidatus Saccharibacteria bacterium]
MRRNQNGFGAIEILILIAVITVLAVAGWLIYTAKYPSPSGKTQISRNPSNTATTQPDNSAARTLQDSKDQVTIDFAKCTADINRFNVAFGSTTIEIKGKDADVCLLNYGGETENPNWDGKLDTSCRVPVSEGKKQFSKNNYGVSLGSIDQFCSN